MAFKENQRKNEKQCIFKYFSVTSLKFLIANSDALIP